MSAILVKLSLFLLTPLREGRRRPLPGSRESWVNFYSRPCGRGDRGKPYPFPTCKISTHAPAGGATTRTLPSCAAGLTDFYSRPCGRGDAQLVGNDMAAALISTHAPAGGATRTGLDVQFIRHISTHAPAGGATDTAAFYRRTAVFLLTPLREGRPSALFCSRQIPFYFYSRPCGRGDSHVRSHFVGIIDFYSRPCGRGDILGNQRIVRVSISTHAPAGGATAIFHKSVMRFCGKLPKDDTVLCLASFGFPGRDPKAVYLAWISCANLPQKCVRQGLALKDQGTSCFHEGLASHAFDPVLV